MWLIRLRECGDREDWIVDAAEAVAAEVAAALGVSKGLAASSLHYARAMGERRPEVAKVFPVYTFCGWRVQQLRDATMIWTSSSGADDHCGQRTARA